jgi:hypothetical protein
VINVYSIYHALRSLPRGVSPELCALAAVPFKGVEPRLLPAAKFNSTLSAALNAAPVFRQRVKRRASDGGAAQVECSWLTHRLKAPGSNHRASSAPKFTYSTYSKEYVKQTRH